jgi:hypothetical protein
MRKEKELQEKLKFYNKKLIGCKGVVYDRIGSPGTAGGERDLYYWMDKIAFTMKQIEITSKKTSEITNFEGYLNDNEQRMFRSSYLEVTRLSIPFSAIKDVRSVKTKLIRKWFETRQ